MIALAIALLAPIQLAESYPVETTLDAPDVPDAQMAWIALIDDAKTSLDIAQFYVSEKPGGRLEPVLVAVEAAAKRGVAVRILADAKFAKIYPQSIDRLDAVRGIEVRRLDLDQLTGGVLHAKYFVVDRQRGWLGSQNFDWRSLEHIQELGVRIDQPALAAKLGQIFDYDWALAVGTAPKALPSRPVDAAQWTPVDFAGAPAEALLVASPASLLPAGADWDLPHLLAAIEGAKKTLRVQLLNYSVIGYDDTTWEGLDAALRAAAKRGVQVSMIVADWNKKAPKVDAVQGLAKVPGITVKFATIPPAKSGPIPFGRVVHAKYLTIDGAWSWVGTSNWSKDYFFSSRNVGLIVRSEPFAKTLEGYFARLWTSAYVEVVDPAAKYIAPKTN